MSAASWTIVALIAASILLAGEDSAPRGLLPAAGAAGLFGVALFGRSLRPLSNTTSGVLLVWIALAVVQASSAAQSEEGALSAVAVLASLCAFSVSHAAVPRRERERLLVAVGVGGTLVAGLALWSTTPGSAASFPLPTPDHLAGWLVLPTLLGVAALCLCAPDGRGTLWTIAWFCIVTLCAAGIAASHSIVGLVAIGVAASALLVLRRVPWRRGFSVAVALSGFALVSLVPALRAPEAAALAQAGFAPDVLGLAGHDPLTRVAALLLSAAIALRRVRPLRRGRGSLAAWGGAGAVFGLASLGLLDSSLEVPAITLTAATLAGLAWPAPRVAAPGDLRRTRALLLLIAVGVAGSLVAGGSGPR